MLRSLGIETSLQLAITVCIVVLVVVTTLGGSGGAPWVFLTYRTILIVSAILTTLGSRNSDFGIGRLFIAASALVFALVLISLLRIPGSHFEAFYLWYKYAFFAV